MSLVGHDRPSCGDPDDPDRRSVRIALAAVLLRRGRTPVYVADTTGVPFALVEWLAERNPPRPSHPDKATSTPLDKAVTEFEKALSSTMQAQATEDPSVSFARARRRVRMLTALSMSWLLGWSLCAIAAIDHRVIIEVTAIRAVAALAVLSMIVITLNRPRRARGRR